MVNVNVLLISAAFLLALVAIYVLYAILMYQGGKGNRGNDLQLSTKNILDQVQVLFDKGEYALVQLLATKYLDRVPAHKEVRQYLCRAYFRDKKYNNAIKQCLIILKNNHSMIDYKSLYDIIKQKSIIQCRIFTSIMYYWVIDCKVKNSSIS